MTKPMRHESAHEIASVEIRVRGRVQGVGFRPTVWRYAQELGLAGDVRNDGEGVLIHAQGPQFAIDALIDRIEAAPPPLAKISSIEQFVYRGEIGSDFLIVESSGGRVETQVGPDARLCQACAAEITDPFSRRYRYAFTTCTHCGPRLSIVTGVPYDRAQTTMEGFPLCEACARDYADPSDRRFHAEATACHACGPKARLIRLDGRAVSFEQHSMLDDVDAVCGLLKKGEIVAIKGLGGYQIACDATSADAVTALRTAKRRDTKPFGLMARDVDVIRRYCGVSDAEATCLESPEAPIVLLASNGAASLPEAVAPGLKTLGFMLPTTPLHHLILRRMDRPVVMTSGNLSDEPQVIDDDEMRERLAGIATYALTHDRPIANRVDDSVVRVIDGTIHLLRRARGYAPAPIALPPEFRQARDLLAFGGELKATFCLFKNGEAILSQHQGDLEDPRTFADYEKNLGLYAKLFAHEPQAFVADLHPEYLSTKLAQSRAADEALPLILTQHHHAHIAACLAENGRSLNAPAVLGVVLDGLGYGDDGTLWGGEFLLADYSAYERLGTFKPIAMLGGNQASREPWRNLYAHLMAEIGWAEFSLNFADLEIYRDLAARPRNLLDSMLKNSANAPLASSCGRLFDAVAAAVDICRERQGYEGEAAARLEAAVDERALREESEELAYPFTIPRLRNSGLPYIEPKAVWNAILGDLILRTPAGVIAARFHRGLARAIVAMALKLAQRDAETGARFDTVALSGGCFHNKILLQEVVQLLRDKNFIVLTHARVPAGDGGLALGQAAIAAARLIGDSACASASPAAL
jgi:hydrogenase maturation protein HypF